MSNLADAQTVTFSDAIYPPLLKETPDPPREIFVRGSVRALSAPAVAVIGTRKASGFGVEVAEQISKELARHGITVISGLALGIDTAAHKGAVDSGGTTVAVLANGIDTVYPASNAALAQKILDTGGAIVSEYPPGTPSYKDHFIRRNRIISGLSSAVVIVEAPARSGALATARFAAEQGRQVFVIPGLITHPNYVGSHALIRDGAILVTSAQDIIEDLGLDVRSAPVKEDRNSVLTSTISSEGQEIYRVLQEKGTPLHIDKIIELTKLEPRAVNQVIALLTVQGIVRETEQGYAL